MAKGKVKDVLEAIQKIVAKEMGMEAEEVTPESRFVEDLGLDSLDVVETVMMVEEKFSIEIADDIVDEVRTVKDLVDHVERQVARR